MGFAYSTLLGAISAILFVIVLLDRAYQRLSHKWTNEPPMLPYTIPIVGHALLYASDYTRLFKYAEEQFPDCKPYSLMMFGKRLYVFTHTKDVTTVFRKSKALPFLPLIESLSGLAWGISQDGMKRLTEVDATGDSLFRNAHLFYRDALKPGPQLDALTLRFLYYLQKELDAFDDAAQQQTGAPAPTSLNTWSKTILGTASTNAMMGPSLLRADPDLLPSVWLVETGFFLFVNKIPRLFAGKHYRARDHVLKAFTSYFEDGRNKEGGAARMIWDREVQLREKGLSTRDVAAYSYSAFAALLNNANPTAYWLLRRIYTHPNAIPKLRAEIAPVFPPGSKSKSITTLDQVHHLLTACPLLRAFYDETLRLHSYSSSNRIVAAPEDDNPTTVGGYTLKQGRNLLLPSYSQHHSPHHFGPNPDRFDPSRFLEPVLPGGKPADAKMVRAFGGGVSLCSGRFFAGNEVLAYAASVLWRYDVRFSAGGVCIVPRKCE